jgi:hypothetical protein
MIREQELITLHGGVDQLMDTPVNFRLGLIVVVTHDPINEVGRE